MIRLRDSSLVLPNLIIPDQEVCDASSSGVMVFNNIDNAARCLMLCNNLIIDNNHILKLRFHLWNTSLSAKNHVTANT
jgi:hypothetical protein